MFGGEHVQGVVLTDLGVEPRRWERVPVDHRHLIDAAHEQLVEHLPALVVSERLLRDRSDRLQQAVASRSRAVLDRGERMVDQGWQGLCGPRRDGKRRGQPEAAGQHCDPTQDRLLASAQQPHAPLDRRTQRSLSVGAAPPWVAEPTQIELQDVQQLADRERVEPCCRQFDRQRHAVEETDNGGDLFEPGAVSRQIPTDCLPSVQEQLRCRAAMFRPQRRDSNHFLPGYTERCTAGGQDRGRRAACQHVVDERGSSVEHVLAVVQHHQRRRCTQGCLDAGEERRRLLDTQRPGGDRWHAVTAGGERQVDELHTRNGLRRDSDSEPSLADTCRSNERHEVTSTEPIDDGGDLRGPPDERGSPLRECAGEITPTGEWAVRRREGRMDEPPHPLGLREPAQENDALVPDGCSFGKMRRDLTRRGIRQHHLAAIRQ